ncbi:OLC1v1000185C1 [Oldenlandia corymbosa var. corymbosa]|uniref:OLC1v1000185C1 n=1 Tax=Oldenlandia corymbosa var. corymbosa TaxID=529605 RepID=A0AAV1D595_OLDCO|nr:OLC1v1000185C1 [Oldenlandia corymbosa var. corymbosa]
MDLQQLLLLLLLTLLPVIILLILRHKNGRVHRRPPPPGPPGIPVIGNLHQFDHSAPHKYLYQLAQKYGPLLSLKLGSLPVVVVSTARMAEEVMKNHDLVFCSRPPMVGQLKLSYNGLDIALAPYNEKWREMRKICVLHLLSIKRVQSFRPVREDEVSRMIGKIRREAADHKITNLSATVMSYATTLICRVAFGKSYNEEDHEGRRFSNLLRDAQNAFVGFYFTDFFPKIGWLDHFTGRLSRLEKVFQELDSFYQELIDEHLDYANRPKSMDGDIIDLMLQLIQVNSSSSSTSSFQLTMDHIKAMLMDVLFGGTGTSASTIIWAMTALMKNPTMMKKLQNEINDFLEKQQKTTVDEDDVEKLPYLKAVVKETLRLYPPAPLLLPRYTVENCVLDGYEVHSSSIVYVNAWAVARDPEHWENPDEFLPERFLDGKVNNVDIDISGREFQFIPFGAGRRGCPGISMGLLTVELALANLLRTFDWELPPGMKKEGIDTDVVPGLTMLKKNDLRLFARQVGATS